MAKPKTSFTELTHQVVREAVGLISLDAIVEGVRILAEGAGATSKNLKQTVRNAIKDSTAIIFIAERGYGWKSHLINGAVQRIVLDEVDLAERELLIDDFQRDLFQPNGPGHYKYGVQGLPKIELADGPSIEVGSIPRAFEDDILSLPDDFWVWLEAQGAQPGDSLLLSVIDADARRYRFSYEPLATCDTQAVAERGVQLLNAALKFVHVRQGQTIIPEMASYLNASGIFHQIPAPPPFEQLWTPEVWGPIIEHYDVSPYNLGGYDPLGEALINQMITGETYDQEVDTNSVVAGEGPIISVGEYGTYQGDLGVDVTQLQARINAFLENTEFPIPDDDPFLPAIMQIFAALALPSPTGQPYQASELVRIFGDSDEILDWIEHGAELGMVNLDTAYTAIVEELFAAPPMVISAPAERTTPSRTLVLRVTYRYDSEYWREIEIADDQSFHDLHLAIQRAFDWDNDHLYAFYMGKRPYDSRTEIGAPMSDCDQEADQVTLGDLNLRTNKKFLYLFDFGDNHLFDIQVKKINPKAPPGTYPRIVAEHGGALAQYSYAEGDGDE
ncbi:plasmid pRiA4b ORF-3 family protein [Candidatus Oscillochloris fontis]|uniref:plasmid pRiA4b ORF-3 family protein n=1 Tax=Candidatus Oscillochloris fontis TaxID=2496868 RepID=UPI00101DAB02|nr:plasmid pRiA4b ORF-3 family protein [Candidatus Oscillochloris fontis]